MLLAYQIAAGLLIRRRFFFDRWITCGDSFGLTKRYLFVVVVHFIGIIIIITLQHCHRHRVGVGVGVGECGCGCECT